MEKVFAVLTCINAFFSALNFDIFLDYYKFVNENYRFMLLCLNQLTTFVKKKVFELKETDVDLYLMPCLFLNISLNVN